MPLLLQSSLFLFFFRYFITLLRFLPLVIAVCFHFRPGRSHLHAESELALISCMFKGGPAPSLCLFLFPRLSLCAHNWASFCACRQFAWPVFGICSYGHDLRLICCSPTRLQVGANSCLALPPPPHCCQCRMPSSTAIGRPSPIPLPHPLTILSPGSMSSVCII